MSNQNQIDDSIRAYHADIEHLERKRNRYKELYMLCTGESRINWYKKWTEAEKIIEQLKKGEGRKINGVQLSAKDAKRDRKPKKK